MTDDDTRRPGGAAGCVRRSLRVVGAVLAVVLGSFTVPDGIVAADPAGPTDYLTEVVSVDPPVDTIVVRILGGDSFVELEVAAGTDVRVAGYRGEPYLWFRTDGTVLENRNSPTTYQNEERFGTDAPAFASADAEPDWVRVADDGSYAWHDHRAHWMQPIRPAGRGPGDQILEAVIPLTVDGEEVDVTVSSAWQPAPSRVPAVAGVFAGGLLIGVALLGARRRRRWPLAFVPVGAVTAAAGWAHYTSLPAETGTPVTTWALPATALVAFVVASVLRPAERFWVGAAVLIGGVQLVLWTWSERDGIGAAILPTTAPDWLHRSAVTLAATTGVGAIVLGGRELVAAFTPASESTPSPPSDRSTSAPGAA